jgi:hypothetical protein
VISYKLKILRLVSIVVTTLFGMSGFCGDGSTKRSKAPLPSSAPKTSNILDFDADVIEGERSGPSILVQMDLQAPNLDTLVFQRKNFNDFHLIDMRRKPKYRGH